MKLGGDRGFSESGFANLSPLESGTAPTHLVTLEDNTVQLPSGELLANALLSALFPSEDLCPRRAARTGALPRIPATAGIP